MNRLLLILLFTCVWGIAPAQVNFVKNPGLENFNDCPDNDSKIYLALGWRNATDSIIYNAAEYFNSCGNAAFDKGIHVPDNVAFYQFPHSGEGMIGGHLYNDKSILMPSPLPSNYRDNLQGHLIKNLTVGKTYCVSFWINSAENAGYVHNKIGAYLDNGSINTLVDTPGAEITGVTPQVYTNDIIEDTMLWVKIEGSFIASGNETYITIGNFFPNSAVLTKYPNYWNGFITSSYYLIDDVSVIPIDLNADAGADRNVPLGKTNKIGRVGDTTAVGLDCKWYRKGALIDSGAAITVTSGSSVGVIDTYVVVQTVCGLVKSDTMLLRTVPTGIDEIEFDKIFSVYPNPSSGSFSLASMQGLKQANVRVYDLTGRIIYKNQFMFSNKEASINLNAGNGIYILEIDDAEGNVYRRKLRSINQLPNALLGLYLICITDQQQKNTFNNLP